MARPMPFPAPASTRRSPLGGSCGSRMSKQSSASASRTQSSCRPLQNLPSRSANRQRGCRRGKRRDELPSFQDLADQFRASVGFAHSDGPRLDDEVAITSRATVVHNVHRNVCAGTAGVCHCELVNDRLNTCCCVLRRLAALGLFRRY